MYLCVFFFILWVSEQRAITSLYSLNLSVFITEGESVYSAVRPGSLNATNPVRPSRVMLNLIISSNSSTIAADYSTG